MKCRTLGSALRFLGINAPTKLLSIALVTAVWVTWSHGATLIVPEEYPTINGAISAAQMGDTVLVNPGTYYEEVNVRPGLIVSSSERWEADIIAPSMHDCGIVFQSPSSQEEENAPTAVIGFDIQQIEDFGDPAICSGNPKAEVKDCYIGHPGPGDNWEIPCIYLPVGGILKMCEIQHGGSSKAIFSNQPGAEIFVEDCVFGPLVFMMGVTGFGSGSVTTFKNNDFCNPFLALEVMWPPTDFTMIFVNNIFSENRPYCPSSGLMPDSVEFRYNVFWSYDPDPDCPEGPGNFVADPLFCNEHERDYRLQPDSPCLGAGENGEDIGARWGICYPTSVGEPELVLGSSLLVSPTVVGGGGCTIRLSLGTDSIESTVEILDVLGRRCGMLHLGSAGPGTHSMRWDGTDDQGRRLPSGVYWIRAPGILGTPTAKVLVLR